MRRFIHGGQPGGQRLFIGVKGFDLIEGSLLRLFRSGEANSQRLLIGVKGFNLLEDGLFLFSAAASRVASGCLSALSALASVKSGLLRLLRSGEANSQRLLIGAKGLNLLEDGLFLFSAAASRVASGCLSVVVKFFLDTPIRW